ncbi:MAG: flagellar basal body P-ring formation protein FlgA [Planctomycetia bacterium]|nr:flagellar basal body P-ring formation protein FlgA [Planctomycetia bacterium]
MKALVPLLLTLAIPAAAATTVELRPEARVPSGYVALADVAEVRGEGLPAVWLGRAPAKGEERVVTAEEVRLELRKAGVALRAVTVSGACVVRGADADPRPGLEGFRETVGRAIAEAARKALPGATVTARVLELDAPEATDFGSVEIAAVKPLDGWWLGEARFRVYVNVGEAASAVWVARASVRGTRRGVVARRTMRAGHRVVSTDLATGDVPAGCEGALAEEVAAVGRVLAADVEEGRPVLAGDLRPGPIVLRGEEVVVTSGAGRATARRTATAMEEGREGDVIRVKNPDSKREFRVRVTGPGAGEAVEEGR